MDMYVYYGIGLIGIWMSIYDGLRNDKEKNTINTRNWTDKDMTINAMDR